MSPARPSRPPFATLALASVAFLVFGLGPARKANPPDAAIHAAVDQWASHPELPLPPTLRPLMDSRDLLASRPPSSGAAGLEERRRGQRELQRQMSRISEATGRSGLERIAVVPQSGLLQWAWIWAPLVFESWWSLGLGLSVLIASGLGLERRTGPRRVSTIFILGGWAGVVAGTLSAPHSVGPLAGGPAAAAAVAGATAWAVGARARPIPGWAPGATLWVAWGLQAVALGGLTLPELWARVTGCCLGVIVAAIASARARAPAESTAMGSAVGGAGITVALALIVARAAPEAGRTATIEVGTVPRGATVTIDGVPMAGETPLMLNGLPVGHVLEISANRDGYFAEPATQTVIVSSEPQALQFDLHPRIDLRVETEPDGALVMLDGDRVGQAPVNLPPLRRGQPYALGLAATDFVTITATGVAVSSTTLTFRLEPAVEVEVVSQPSGARVFIDDREVGVTPTIVRAPERRFELRLERPGYRALGRRVDGRRLGARAAASDDGIGTLGNRRAPRGGEDRRGREASAPTPRLELQLRPRPLSELNLAPEDREEATRLLRTARQLRTRRARAEASRARAVRALTRARSQPTAASRLERLINLENQVDRLERGLDALDEELRDVEGQLDGIRESAADSGRY